MLSNYQPGYAPSGQFQQGNFAVNSGVQNTLLYQNIQMCVGKVTQYLVSNGIIRPESSNQMPAFYADLNHVYKIAELLAANGFQNPWVAQIDENSLCAAMYEYMKQYNNSGTSGLGQTLQSRFGGMNPQPYTNNLANVYGGQQQQQPMMQQQTFGGVQQQPVRQQTFGGINQNNGLNSNPLPKIPGLGEGNPFVKSTTPIPRAEPKPLMKIAYIPLEKLQNTSVGTPPAETSKDEASNTVIVTYPDSVDPVKIDKNLEEIQEKLDGHPKYIIKATEKANAALDNVAKEDIEGLVALTSKMTEKNDLFSDVVMYLSTDGVNFNVPAVAQLLVNKFNEAIDLGAFRKWMGDTIIHMSTLNEIISLINGDPIDVGDGELNSYMNNLGTDYRVAAKEVANRSVLFVKGITNIKKKSHSSVTYSYKKPVIFTNVDLGEIIPNITHVGDSCIIPPDHIISQYVKSTIGEFSEFTLKLNKNNVLFYTCSAMQGDELQITRIE